ncbi:hypothetical protein, partial [Chryseobacterium sp. S90]|uniref:hypothetical protein n=1 Tax=Chryseobacterium sp. S90 TaxID=3395373 RepID=UPI0039BD708D
MAIKLVNKIYQGTGIQIVVGMVFSHKSIAGLSLALEGLQEVVAEDIRPVRVRNCIEQYLSFGQERLWFIESYEGGSHAY